MEELTEFVKNNNLSPAKQDLLNKLFNNNKNLLKTIKLDFINSDYFERLDFNLLQAIVSLDGNVQSSFLSIEGNKRELFYKLIDKFSKTFYQFPYVNALLKNFTNGKFYTLLNSIKVESLSDKDLNALSLILTSKDNVLDIDSLDRLRNINKILDKSIRINRNIETIDEYKNYKLLEKMNLSLPEARLICQKYCYDLDHFHVNDPLINDLKSIKEIVLSNSLDDIDSLINSISINKISYPDFQTMCQNLYENEFNYVLFNPDGKEYKDYEGCKLIDAGLKFNMVVRANGFFSRVDDSFSPSQYWNNNIRETLSFSNSLLSNDFFRNVSFFDSNNYLMGFSNIPKNSLAQCCMGDDATIHSRKKTLDVRSFDDDRNIHPNTGDACGQQFRPLEEMIKHGAGEYQEVTLERFSYDGDKESRVNPSYIVYFKKDESFKEQKDFEIALEAAKSFSIPIVVIDVNRVMRNDLLEIEKSAQNDLSIDNVVELIRRYRNLVNSFYSTSADNLLPKIFQVDDPIKYIDYLVKKYIALLESENLDKDSYQELFDKLMLLNDEKRCIKPGTLVAFKRRHDLDVNYNKYIDIIYGITYKDQTKCFLNKYQFEKTEEIFDYILSCGLELTDAVIDNDCIGSIVSSAKIENIPLTQTIISYTWKEFVEFVNKRQTLKMLDSYPSNENIDIFFSRFSNEEIIEILQPIIDNLCEMNRLSLIDHLRLKLKERNLEDKFIFNIKENNANLWDDSFENVDVSSDWYDDFSTGSR